MSQFFVMQIHWDPVVLEQFHGGYVRRLDDLSVPFVTQLWHICTLCLLIIFVLPWFQHSMHLDKVLLISRRLHEDTITHSSPRPVVCCVAKN